MKQILILLTLFVSFNSFAQVDPKYLEGKVPVEDGKVVFSKTFDIPGLDRRQVYLLCLRWATTRFADEKNRVVYSDIDKGDIVALGEEYLVFSDTPMSLDRSLLSYRLIIQCEDGRAEMKMTGIRYEYKVQFRREPERYIAEEWITDNAALSRGRLNRTNGKFRTATIDYAEDLFKNAGSILPKPVPPATTAREQVPVFEHRAPRTAVISQPPSTLSEYRQVEPERIPGNIIKMLSEDWMLITAGNDDEFNMMTASWGGLGNMFGKPVMFCFINPARHTYSLMEKYDTYTLTFYTETYRSALEYAGSHSGKDTDKVEGSGLTPITMPSGSKAFEEAWMIIECRKLVAQPLSQDVITNEEERKKWDGREVSKMYVGEIVNVWIK